MKCAVHPDVETNLSCAKCGKPICPKCLIQTPVGARCRQCANLKRPPMYVVPARYYARAVGAGLVTAAVAGVAWSLVPWGGLFLFLLAAGVGYVIAEAISLSVNRKRGLGLQSIAGVSVCLSYVVSRVSFFDGNISISSSSILNPYGLIALAIGIVVAVSLLR